MTSDLLDHLSKILDHPSLQASPVSGGCIHQAFELRSSTQRFFVKLNQEENYSLFISEADALQAIAATNTIRVPQPITHGIYQSHSYLILEHLTLRSSTHPTQAAAMGRALAELHRHTSPDHLFGWPTSNHIGATPQPNKPHQDWITFWRNNRLGWQLQLASHQGLTFPGSDELLDLLPMFFRDYQPVPSLLHGDLWNGNAAFDQNLVPVIFDPASYYGDRETDLAFTELFGGFPPAFYQAYDKAYLRHPNWPQRRDLYNLYHFLNHHHLFGGHYTHQARQMIQSLVQSARRLS